MRARFPVFIALLVWAVACSYWNDNHAVRTLADAQPERQSLRASLRSWLERHEDKLARGKEKIPLYLVNAEGGGIRAAYWTVTVLGQIQADNPCFADHLYSLSGVSGGSLGASIFVALLAEAPLSAPCDAPAVNRTLDIKETAQRILSEDFLAPVVGAMLYPDLGQRFWPWPIESFDRAATLEQAWEKAWAKHVPGSQRMREPMDRLWADARPKQWMPALFLNATWVETGKRIIASNVRIANPRRRSEDFVDSEDANAFFAPRSLALSTAAHMSARFTYVSPAGTLVRNGETHGRVVDGGYFENSGATATLEILQTIDAMAERDPRWRRVEPIVIHISNDPVDAKYGSDSLLGAHQNPYVAPADILHEVLSPLWTLLNTRDARGYHARESVMWHVWPNFLHFGLCRRSSNVPLGWVLSQSTQQRMEAQLAGSCGVAGAAGFFDNAGNLRRIGARLGREAGV